MLHHETSSVMYATSDQVNIIKEKIIVKQVAVEKVIRNCRINLYVMTTMWEQPLHVSCMLVYHLRGKVFRSVLFQVLYLMTCMSCRYPLVRFCSWTTFLFGNWIDVENLCVTDTLAVQFCFTGSPLSHLQNKTVNTYN